MPARLPAVVETAVRRVEAAVRSVVESTTRVQDSRGFRQLQDTLNALTRALGDAGEPRAAPPRLPPADETGTAVAELLTWILEGSALEHADGEHARFRAAAGKAETPPVHPDVARFIDALALRVTLRVPSPDGSEWTFTAGAQDKTLITVVTGPGSLEFLLDLAGARGALDVVASAAGQVLGEEGPVNVDGLELTRLSGVVSVALRATSAAALEFTLDVREDIRITGQSSAGPLDIRVAKSRPALRVVADGAAGTGSMRVELGRISLRLPRVENEEDDGLPSGPADVVLPALRGELEVHAGERSVTLKGLSVGAGQATLNVGEVLVAGLEVNPDAGRALAMRLSLPDGADHVDVETVTPFSLVVRTAGGDYRVGAPAGAVLQVAAAEDADEDELVRVLQGDLVVSSARTRHAVTVRSGQGLFALDEELARADETDDVLRLLTAR